MNAIKEINSLIKTLITFVIIAITACSSNKSYWIQKNENDQILLGSVQKSILIKHHTTKNWFEPSYSNYQIDTNITKELKNFVKPMQVLVFAGSWCSDTQRELPKFCKIADAIGLNQNQIEIHLLNQEKKGFYINESVFHIKAVPTFIFMENGKEIGRIIEMSTQLFEKEWLDIYQLNHLK